MMICKILSCVLMIVICIIFFFLGVTGCTSHVIPISYGCPKIILPNDPIIPIDKIDEESSSDEVIKAWVVTAYAYREWNLIVREQIEETND